MTVPVPRGAEVVQSAVPDLILASAGLEAWAREILPGRDVLLFDAVLSGRRAVDAETNALVLWSPEHQPFARTADLLEALSSRNAGFGLVPCDDRDLARAFLERTLAWSEVADRGRTGVVSSAFAPHGRPACVAASPMPGSRAHRTIANLPVVVPTPGESTWNT